MLLSNFINTNYNKNKKKKKTINLTHHINLVIRINFYPRGILYNKYTKQIPIKEIAYTHRNKCNAHQTRNKWNSKQSFPSRVSTQYLYILTDNFYIPKLPYNVQ